LTALLIGGEGGAADVDEEDEDDEYAEEFDEDGPNGPPSAISTGTKRGREDDDEPSASTASGELEGDYGEVDENSDVVTKKARTSSEES